MDNDDIAFMARFENTLSLEKRPSPTFKPSRLSALKSWEILAALVLGVLTAAGLQWGAHPVLTTLAAAAAVAAYVLYEEWVEEFG